MNRLNSTAEMRAADAAHHIHPFTNTRELNAKGARIITGAEGVWLTDSDGNRILDGMAGLWCTAVGKEELLQSRCKFHDSVSKRRFFPANT